MSNLSKVLVGCILVQSCLSFASSVTVDMSRSTDYQSTSVSAEGPLGEPASKRSKAEKATAFDWNLFLSRSSVRSTSTTGQEVTDVTSTVSGGAGLETPGRFTAGADFQMSSTPDESLLSYGPSVSAGYTYPFTGAFEEDFLAKTGVKITASKQDYVQTFKTGSSGRRLARPTTGTNSITQNSVELSWFVKPVSWGRLKLAGTSYSYSKDVNEFLAFLDVQPAQNETSGLSTALSGFAKSDSSIEIDFYFLETWELDLKTKVTKLQSDSSTSTYRSLAVFKDIGSQWRFGFSTKQSKSDSSTTTTTENGISVAYDF